MPNHTAPKWTNVDCGPIQLKRVSDALGRLRTEGSTSIELSGVVGLPETERRHTITRLLLGRGEPNRTQAAIDRIGEAHHWTVSRATLKALLADLAAALATAEAERPVVDQRESEEEVAARRHLLAEDEARRRAESERAEAMREQLRAKQPAGATLIVAELHEDTSQVQADHFSNRTVRTVAIGWRHGAREDFRQLRAAAARFPETAHLGPQAAPDIEHRDTYSLGKGNYLSDHGWDGAGSGWVVRSCDLRHASVDEDAVPAPGAAAQDLCPVPAGATLVRESDRNPDNVEVVFAERPAEQVLATLKAAGFRWSLRQRCWYGRRDRLPAAVASLAEAA